MTTRFAYVALCAVAFLARSPAAAQERVCKDSETVFGCHDRLANEAVAAAADQQKSAPASEEEELQKTATGLNVGEAAQSAIRDFLPRFAGSLLTSDPTKDVQALDLRFNTPLVGSPRTRLVLQGGLTLHSAELFQSLVDSIPSGIREASRKRLADDLEDGDDATGSVGFNVESRYVGRTFAFQQNFVDSLARAVVDSATRIVGGEPESVIEFEDEFVERLGRMSSILLSRQDDPACIIANQPQQKPKQLRLLPVGCLTGEVRAELEEQLTPVTRYEARRQFTIANLLESSGFERLSALVNNQPQFNAVAQYRSRVAVVGPNEWVGRVRYETGFANMNGLRRLCSRRDAVAVPDSARSRRLLNCLHEYTNSPRIIRSLGRGDRLFFEGQVRYRPTYHVALKSDSVDFTLGSAVGFGISGGYGAYLGSSRRKDEDRDRIDLHASYDHADGADLRQSRFLAGLFYTLKVSGNVQGVVGLAWANKPEFLDGADRRLHANLGLSYKFNRGKSEQ